MLKKCFSLASAVGLGGAVLWMTSTAACGGDEATPVANPEGGASSSSSSGGMASSSSSGGMSSGDMPGEGGTTLPTDAGKNPADVKGVVIPFTKCPAFTKCDGPVAGNFVVSGGCLADNTFDQFKQFCAGLNVHDVTIKASGTVTADTKTISRDLSVFVDAQLDIDKTQCPFVDSPLVGGCKGLADKLKSGTLGGPKFDVMDCADATGACKCHGQVTTVEKSAAPENYTTDNAGTLTTNTNGVQRTFDYCPKDPKLTYQETTKDNATFSVFLEITKK